MKNGAWLGFIADLVGGFNQLEKYESQWKGLSLYVLWEKNVWNHQPVIYCDIQRVYWLIFISGMILFWLKSGMGIWWKYHGNITGEYLDQQPPTKLLKSVFRMVVPGCVVPLCFPDIFQVSNRIPTSLSCLVMLYPCIKLWTAIYCHFQSYVYLFNIQSYDIPMDPAVPRSMTAVIDFFGAGASVGIHRGN